MTWYSNMPAKRLEFIDDLEVWVIEKKRLKHPNLRVQPDGRVEFSVPHGYPPEFIVDFVREKHDWIVKAQQKYETSPMGRAATASQQEVREWRQVVEAFTPALVEKWEPVLGVKAGKLAYRKMKSRWGSCQPSTGRICINVVLALYPPECLEYVVVHELAHLLVPGHGPEFHAIMDRVMPDWKQRRAKLRD
ncbi:MAG: M48 family metallopeptidase [Eggerthellaceae bacterium]|nr:M48 family metallopeptidase [Eggerthellaceae bacterium]